MVTQRRMSASPSHPPAAAAAAQDPKRILIVDDEPEIRRVLSEFLAQAQPRCALVTASSAEEALEVVGRERPDLVLLDVNMSGRDGVDALQEIRRMDPTIQVVMITGADVRSAAAALQHGALGYIPKPFDLRYVEHLVAAALEAS